ncbi:MAG: M23 family metallopeptidase [Deltaproteobacteria bacterium]
MTKRYIEALLIFAALAGFVFSTLGSPDIFADEAKTSLKKPDNTFTPVVVSVLNAPNPVRGSVGNYHLVYELELLNATPMTWEIGSIEVKGEKEDDTAFLTLEGDELKSRMRLITDTTPSTTLAGGETGIVFVHFFVKDKKDIPRSIIHRVSIGVPGGIPAGFADFAGLPEGAEEYSYASSPTEVGSQDAVVIAPPLQGKGWVAADGCCDSIRHVRSMMPINDKLRVAQRFAIDWEVINENRLIFIGDPKDVESYFSYGKNVLAVRDARVVTAVDKYENQIPGELPPGMTLEEADGNHVVLDLGDGRYALYAHLKPGSVRVKEGDTVKQGQVIGLLGNTGNTSAPHLHFHVMDGHATLGSNGLPYVIDEFDLIEKAPSTEAFDKAEREGTPLEVVPVKRPGLHKNALPLDQRVVNFPST